ncbi:sigma factor, partial [Sneathiella sp.]|uniref:RNA polymerase sigma factor n=1 Tax=Sneathiella sp. TaxID=1964365 RepID=UPI00262DA5A4
MNPLRQETISKSEFSLLPSLARSTLPLPVKLSIAALQTEIPPADENEAEKGAKSADICPKDKETPDEFWEAWHSHKAYLIKLSMVWMNVSAADAEDAFSDATIRAYEKYAAHAPQISNERAWFARLLHNICIDKHRANKRIRNLYDKVKEIST